MNQYIYTYTGTRICLFISTCTALTGQHVTGTTQYTVYRRKNLRISAAATEIGWLAGRFPCPACDRNRLAGHQTPISIDQSLTVAPGRVPKLNLDGR